MSITRIGVTLGVALVTASVATPAYADSPTLDWQPCAEIAKNWDPGDKASECAMVQVPLDYSHPDGRQLNIAISRIKAKEPAKRRGALLINPGGPGISGTPEPALLTKSTFAEVGRYYDLIGFDTRGVGYSDNIRCPELEADTFPATPPELTGKERAKFRADNYGKAVSSCAAKDPELARSMNTANIARDVDRIRVALGEQKISYFGRSWGTALGSAYRSMFDDRVDRMLLESVLAPGQGDDDHEDQLAAKERLFYQFTAWLAKYDEVYHFGTTAQQVEQALLALRDAHPDKNVNYFLLTRRDSWADAAKELAALRDGQELQATPTQPDVQAGYGWSDEPQSGGDFSFVLAAINCNDSPANRNFEAEWQQAEQNKRKYPIAGFDGGGTPRCEGWPFPASPTRLAKGNSTLQLVGHEFESTTPIEWAHQMQDRIGGELLTIQDDVHSGLLKLPCADKAVDFFVTGRTSSGSCPGAPIPAPSNG